MQTWVCLTILATTLTSRLNAEDAGLDIFRLNDLINGSANARAHVLHDLDVNWNDTMLAGIRDIFTLVDTETRRELLALATEKTESPSPLNVRSLDQLIWSRPISLDPNYAEFKSLVYRQIDSRFAKYFSSKRKATIRLDEVLWGGVKQNGIPPLRQPKMMDARNADDLDDEDVVFGVALNGDVRAYPKRILGWHELVTDVLDDVPFAGVYCTLCGSFIGYVTRVDNTDYNLGTSGFLYRSNKLMFDESTKSLWNTLTGEPVVGPLVGKGIKLKRLPVVTTTWGEWQQRHPNTTVLSLDTGHQRDYSTGASYGDYWSTDELMFEVPIRDRRLNNKDEVLAILPLENDTAPLAIAHEFLLNHSLHPLELGALSLVVLTDGSGAHRVYHSDGIAWESWDQQNHLRDTKGTDWTVHEGEIRASGGKTLKRYPSHNAFWFGWINSHPGTALIK